MTYSGFDLMGKVALVTGGNGGIGLGMAKAVAEAGAAVCIWGTNDAKNAAAVDVLKATGARAEALICDVGDESAVTRAMAETVERFGRIDGCFANSGVGGVASSVTMKDEEWQRVMRVNLDGAFYTLREAGAHMVARAKQGDPGGRLVGVSSLGAIMGYARALHYTASKGALISMMRALAVELGRHKITANAILPGHIETAMTKDRYEKDEKFVKAVMPRLPIRRWGTPEDFGGIAVYLMSGASAYHTGDEFLIDGGFFLA